MTEIPTAATKTAATKTIVITGGSDGIGAAAAELLTGQGHHVVVVGRSPEKTATLAQRIGADHLLVDFTRLDQVRRLAAELQERYPRIDVLANNAGGVMGDRTVTVDGFERTFQVNHLAPLLLTTVLMDTLSESRATVIATASEAHRFGRLDISDLQLTRGYRSMRAYGNGKLANILTTRELERRYGRHGDGPGIASASFHPGVVATQFAREGKVLTRLAYAPPLNRLLVSPAGGADQLVWLATTEPGIAWTPGTYYVKRRPGGLSKQGKDDELARRLWGASVALLGLPAS